MEIGKFSVVVHLCWKDGDRVGKQSDCIIGIRFRKPNDMIGCCYRLLLLKLNGIALWYIFIYVRFVILCAV